ncbi:50S ribosomal protein L9 [Verrucomicrobiales bacterium]|nr:50S ribosomal protein L9 [Verrucomicrobiales bacterium]
MATASVILKEKIDNLGAEADVVKVKAGFARNFLVPQGKAYEATKANLAQIESLKVARAAREAQEIEQAEKTATKLRKMKITLTLSTGQGGKAFGSITTIDIAKAISEKGVEIDRHQIVLSDAIKTMGKFDIPVKVYSDIEATVKLTVEPAEGAEEKSTEEE